MTAADQDGTRTGSYVDILAVVALGLLLLATPWPLGSRLPWAATLSATAAIVVAGAWLGSRLLTGHPATRPAVLPPMIAFLALGLLQLVIGSTVYAFGTRLAMLSYAACAGLLVLVHATASSRAARAWLTGVLLTAAGAVAVFALVQHATWNGMLFWSYEPPMGGTSPFGPFNNRNYHAGYMLAALGPALGLSLAPRTGWWRWPALIVLSVGAGSVVLSLSRTGVLALAVAILVAGAGAVSLRGGEDSRRWFRPALTSLVVLLLVVALAGAMVYGLGETDRVAERMATFLGITAERSAEGRLVIWRDTLGMIADRPLMGFGMDTFMWAHLAYRSTSNGFPQHAHNEYLEMLAETGIVGGALCLWFLVLLGRGVLRGLRDAPSGFEAGLRLGAIASWIGILVFAAADFPTVIPATNYVLATLAGLALMPPRRAQEIPAASPSRG